jgi:hypothetical protein
MVDDKTKVRVLVMDISLDPPKQLDLVQIGIVDYEEVMRGSKVHLPAFKTAVANHCKAKGLSLHALNRVHSTPEGMPNADFVLAVKSESACKVSGSQVKHRRRPVMRGGKQIQPRPAGGDVGMPSKRVDKS